jgi:hypothetical protein
MFQEEQHIPDALCFSQSNQLLLQSQAGGVIDGPELKNGNHERNFVIE